MIDMYRVQFVRPLATASNPQSPTRICIACAAGHHEQPLLGGEICDCPCHGTPLQSVDYRVAA
jgi:hypothetical protein